MRPQQVTNWKRSNLDWQGNDDSRSQSSVALYILINKVTVNEVVSPVGQNEVVTNWRTEPRWRNKRKLTTKDETECQHLWSYRKVISYVATIVMNVLKSWMAADKHSASKPFVRMAWAGEHHAYHNRPNSTKSWSNMIESTCIRTRNFLIRKKCLAIKASLQSSCMMIILSTEVQSSVPLLPPPWHELPW